ncbi:sulfate ABC transporter substrate-binding protein [Thauera linaloolentis]|uniref:Putative sulfate transport system substrate-binding protein n=1 Tax=Thauera linaloolentis (strain DSM 12138 / JCM 21573 / CCUG 41526 / CIP 105981 / IAM 15112 / NBRC 102519 / 47Lol) TaxID=1123367 RepID=N6Z0Z7_THAL4|nr:sulfate ABC transporter substrate-binding protein [Thauera linaloolentis]ENO88078.1 putative sulfate transport system substrate-binding protein [Thauera linaloolentis 47Lol = DSM 12138]MCM8565215.1 sulfate ABC transporter substrate-binding protein [Thauera linaloolentis]
MNNTPRRPNTVRRVLAALALSVSASAALADTTLLNVSYDVSRELYKDINPAFSAQWKAQGGEAVTVNQSHGGSSKQALSVAAGLEADVVTMNQSPDIDILVERGGLVEADWRKRFPHEATPYTTTSVFLVRKGNPKNIKDWDDLARAGLQVIVPNPKTSGNGRYTYLAAWGYALDKSGSDADARAFVGKLFANVPVLDGGGRGATTTFTQRDVGDVLVTFENEAILIARELGDNKFDVVYPSISIDASAPVAVVKSVTEKRGTAKAAEAYLQFLFSPEGQTIIAKHNFRPRDAAVLAKNADKFPPIRTFTVDEKLGGWPAVQKTHFADGGIYDQIVEKR